MKTVAVIICLAFVGAGAAVASTGKAGKKATWTESKAERQVLRGATVRLPAEDRVALEAEVRPLVLLYEMLAMASALGEYDGDATVYYEQASKYSRILDRVQRGLPIDAVDCSGSGGAIAGGRFSTFRCSVTTESLELPPAQLAENGEPPTEEQARSIGPIEAELDVRVTGTSTFAYRKL